MSEKQEEYKTEIQDAMEMLGKGYDHPSLEIYPQQTIIRRHGWEMQEEIIPAFVKISTSFKKELKNVGGTALKIWIFIALSINRNTEQAHPGIRTIADACGVSQNTVISAIKELESYNLLSVNREDRKYNIYEIPEYVSANSKTASKTDADIETASIENKTASLKPETASVGRGLTREPDKPDNKRAQAPRATTIEQAIYSDQPVTADMLSTEAQQLDADIKDAAWLICQNNHHLEPLAIAFMETRGIVLSTDKTSQGGHRKALKQMHEAKPNQVKPEHVRDAILKLKAANMTVKDLFSIIGTAIDLANPMESQEEDYHSRLINRMERL